MAVRSIFFLIGLFLISAQASAADSQRHQQIDGMDIYFGVVPAQITQNSSMHGGSPKGQHRYHVLLALFDSETGVRIDNANVKASVAPLGMLAEEKALEPMPGGVLSYGNYFVMHEPGYYQIIFDIQRTRGGNKSVAKFVYQRPRD